MCAPHSSSLPPSLSTCWVFQLAASRSVAVDVIRSVLRRWQHLSSGTQCQLSEQILQKPTTTTTTTSTLVDSLQGCKPNISWWPVGVWESGATTGAGLLSTQQAKPCGAPLLYTGAPPHPGGTPTQAWTIEYLPKNFVCSRRSSWQLSRFNALLKFQPGHKND